MARACPARPSRRSAQAPTPSDVECAARDGDTWAFGGTTKETTVPGERAGDWSAVVVKDGSPQQVAIWLSDSKTEGIDCDGWLAAIEMSTVDLENFRARGVRGAGAPARSRALSRSGD